MVMTVKRVQRVKRVKRLSDDIRFESLGCMVPRFTLEYGRKCKGRKYDR